jgi:CRISPR type III-B/RAMP module-associated protein Cmr5
VNQTLDQVRARYAYEKVTSADKQFILQLPQMIRAYGLGQTLAFLRAVKENKEHADLVYQALEGWLCGAPDDDHPMRVYQDATDLLRQLISGGRAQYQAAQQEALALASWLKRMAEQPKPASAAAGGGDAPAVQ